MTARERTRTELQASARRLMAAMAGTSHLRPEELVSYQAGELGAGERRRAREHLAACPECTRAVLDMASFPDVEPLDGRDALTTEDVARRWQRLRARLDSEERASAASRLLSKLASRLLPALDSLRFHQAVAAALLAVTVGLSWTLLSERRPAGEALGPQLNVVLTELAPAEASGRRGEAELLRLPPEAAGVVLSLALVDRRSYPAYEIEIVAEASGATAWRSSDLHRGPEGNFTVGIERGYLPASSYRIEIRGLDGDRREPLATYRLTLAYE